MRKWFRVLAFVLAILAIVAVGFTGTRYRIAQLVEQSRLERQKLELVLTMQAAGRTEEQIQAAVENMLRRYDDKKRW